VAFLVAVAELGRLGASVEPWVDDVATDADGLARSTRRRTAPVPWPIDAGLAAAGEVFSLVDHRRGVADVAAARARRSDVDPTPSVPENDLTDLAWALRRTAIERAGVVDLFDGDDPITALASSNAAFETLRASPGGAELLDDPDRLAALLRRQIVVEALSAAEFPTRPELQTAADAADCALLGADDSCSVLQTGGDASDPTVEGASFLVTDVDAANGLLDVIDRVLVP